MARAVSTPDSRVFFLTAMGLSVLLVAVWMNLPHPTGDPIPTGPKDHPIPSRPPVLPPNEPPKDPWGNPWPDPKIPPRILPR